MRVQLLLQEEGLRYEVLFSFLVSRFTMLQDVWTGRLNKQRVCIKVLRFFQQGSDREELLKALSKEVLLWRQLNHPNILPFLGVNTELFAPSFCIVSPWMSNGDIMTHAQNSSLDLGAKLQHVSYSDLFNSQSTYTVSPDHTNC